ncbi:TPA_asm: L [Triticum alphacytorhabdovirus 1]|nr:TPA_asm: L [Triticum alphacytorhabdovirus 1]
MDHDGNSYGEDCEEGPNQQYDSLPDYHLRNPLKSIREDVEKFMMNTNVKVGSIRFRQSLKSLMYYSKRLIVGEHTDLICHMDNMVMTEDISSVSKALGDTLDRLEMDKVFSSFFDVNGMIDSINHLSKEIEHSHVIRMRNFQDMLLIMNALSSRRPVPEKFMSLVKSSVFSCKVKGGEMYITGSHLGLTNRERSDDMTIYDADWVRCASDVATERFLLHISSVMGHDKNKCHYPPWDLINDIIEWGDRVISEHRNEGYKLLKIYEALCTGYLMMQGNDEIVDNTLFFKNTVRDAVADNALWTRPIFELKTLLRRCEEIHWISQIYGLHRIWGHPITDAAAGMEKVIKIGRKEICLSDRAPLLIGNHFKFLLFQGFMKKYKRYPMMTYSGDNDSFREAHSLNDPKLISETEFPMGEWANVTLSQNFQLPETFNLSMVVADKSVSPSLSELAKNIKQRRTVMNAELRRGVLRWLNDTAVDPRELLREINEGNFPKDQKIIGLTPKERELNPVPRMFALMSHLMRVYVVVTEAMLSEHILPLFPQVTMTDSLLDLSKKIYNNARNQTYNDKKGNRLARKTICMSLDFEKWNGHMRKSSTYHVFRALGDVFGMPELYNATYDIFEASYIYLADGSYVPKVEKEGFKIEEPMSFTGHKGGMEGLRQKGWTIFTVVGLDYVCRRHNCQYNIMGMGDNQVLMLTYFTYKVDGLNRITQEGKREIKKKHDNLFADLMNLFSELGLPLKPLETWASECLFLYGKYPVWKGMPLTMDLKRLMRVFAFSNMSTMTAENIENTVAGSATAAAQSAPSVFLSYVVGLIMLFMSARDLVQYHPLTARNLTGFYRVKSGNSKLKKKVEHSWSLRTSKKQTVKYTLPEEKMNEDILSRLICTVPRTIGGYVTFNLPTLAMRGFPDPLSKDLMTVRKWCTSKGKGSLKSYLRNWSEVVLMPDRNYGMLIEDILSVNHLNPVTPMSNVRQSVNDFLSDGSRINNVEFRDLMAVCNRANKESLAQSLCKGDELHIRLLHDIYSSTILGYSDSIISKVTKTSTLQKLAISKASQDVTQKMGRIETNYILYFIWRSGVRGVEWRTECSTEYAKDIRFLGWGKILKGVTIAHPFEYMKPQACYDREKHPCSCIDGYVSVHLSDLTSSAHDWDRSIGSSLPYLGSMTKEKVTVQSGSKIYSSEPLVRRPISLLRTVNWFVPPDSYTASVIKSCLRAVTNIDPDEFMGISEGTSGAEAHRYKDTSLSHGSLTMCNYLYSTRFHSSTDNFYRYSKGGENYDLHFQSLLCSVTEAANQIIFKSGKAGSWIPRCIHWRQCCETCINIVDDDFTDLPNDLSAKLIPSKPRNKYLYVEKERVSYIEDQRPFEHLINSVAPDSRYIQMSPEYKYHLLVDMMSDYIASGLFSGEGEIKNDEKVDLHGGEILNRVAYLKLSPSDLLMKVADKILCMCSWKMSINADVSLGSRSLKDTSLELIAKAYSGCFLGLGLLYSWSETKINCKPPLFARLDEDPPSLVGACNAAKYSLYNLIASGYSGDSRRTLEIVEELKDHGISYKLVIISQIQRIKDHCKSCVRELQKTEVHSFKGISLSTMCGKGHIIMERYSLKCNLLRVSMDRLKKDALGVTRIDTKRRNKLALKIPLNMNYNTVTDLFNYRDYKMNLEVRSKSEISKTAEVMRSLQGMRVVHNTTDVTRYITKPTSALYKYSEIFSKFHQQISKNRKIWLLGDGSGFTSDLVGAMFNADVTVSTLINSENVIPQTMPHLFEDGDSRENIDRVTMVNKVNNILNDEWSQDWIEVAERTTAVVSDIELLGETRADERSTSLEKLLKLSNWSLVIWKDYVYDYGEFCDRFSMVAKATKTFEVVSCQHRQKSRPEIWWVIRNSSKITSDRDRFVVLHDRVMTDIWRRFVHWFEFQDNTCHFTTVEIEKSFDMKGADLIMKSRAKLYCSLPTIGSLFPEGRDFTNVLGRLQRGNKPTLAGFSRNDPKLRLYDSDREKIRERLLIISISMLARPEHRAQLLNESDKWTLEWFKSKKLLAWTPYLKRCDLGGNYGMVSSEYIGILNRLFNEKGMLFNSFGDKIEFRYDRKNKVDKLMLPVAKNMIIRLPIGKND